MAIITNHQRPDPDGQTLLALKVGRHSYEITSKDEFMDNGACVQLLTQSKEVTSWGCRPRPTLSKRAIKGISKFERVQTPQERWRPGVQVFTLGPPQ